MPKSEPQNTNAEIIIRGAREHNLKNISLNLPHGKMICITGPSGSGKSSLAFDTLFAEGQRRFLESLSPYARQFLDQLSRPDVDLIDGLAPCISIDQKTISAHPRSTVGTVTGIYDFFRLLFARVGEVKDPDTGETLKPHTDDDIFLHLDSLAHGTKVQVFASVVRGRKGEFLREFEGWRRTGFSKVRIDGGMKDLFDPILLSKYQSHDIDLMVDTLVVGAPECHDRLTAAFKHVDRIAEGWLKLYSLADKSERLFSRKIASSSSEKTFPDLEPRLFSFNSPYGMCEKCRGVGLIIEEKKKILRDDDIDEVNEEEVSNVCPSCKGTRLRQEANWVLFKGKSISEWACLPTSDLKDALSKLYETEKSPISRRILEEILPRLDFMKNVGVSYLALDRRVSTISGGEAQRLRLATQLGSELSGVLYILDEPSIGLHPADNDRLLKSLRGLRDMGNTVVIVEHDEETMLSSDLLVDIGPGAGRFGGELMWMGDPKDIKNSNAPTAAYLTGKELVFEKRTPREPGKKKLKITSCSGHNLKNVDCELPLGLFIVFTGVSGSGKSSLARDTLEVALAKELNGAFIKQPLPYKKLEGAEQLLKSIRVDQRAIGRTPRSNPATYTGLFSHLRTLFSQLPDSQIRGYTPGTFSFNTKGGRCETCEGAGQRRIEMHFLPDVFVECESCAGARYRREILEILFKGKNISEVLKMSVEEAYEHFKNQPVLEPKLKTLLDVGLGYLRLGQSSTTLSGGEAQRIKLAKELSKRSTGKTIYFLDEPTTGLHFHDVKKLLELLQRLVEQGNTVVVIEHNLDVIAAADWLVDMGPGPGNDGGDIVYQGPPKGLIKDKKSATAKPLKAYFERRSWL
ncbi:MAG: excinuclease ABC subunit UvrA [Bdellovibrionota bacterium]